jgi:hypothetical protein
MIVELPSNPSDSGSGRNKHYRMGFFHFSNNNLSLRRSCALELGGYDSQASKSEDVDLCIRLALNKEWVAVREKDNIVRHKARKTLWALVRQMWGWGYHVGYPLAKTGLHGLYLYWMNSWKHRISADIEIDSFPFLACIFLADWHAANIFLGIAVLASLINKFILSAVAFVLGSLFLWRSFHDVRAVGLRVRQTILLAIVHYLVNMVFITAAVLGALKHRILFIPSPIFRPKSPDE